MPNFYRFLPCLRIGTVGDSLAAGGGPPNNNNWQLILYGALTRGAKMQIQFVGSANGPPPIWADPHPGKRIDEIDTFITTETIPLSDPDLIIIMAGTNDALQGADGATMLTRTQTLLTNLFTLRPALRVIYAKPPPLSLVGVGVTQSMIDALAAYAAGLTATWASTNFTNRLLSIVDCWTGFDADTMLLEGIHPNALGAQFFVDTMLATGVGPIVDPFGHQADSISL
jgi:lysophospholipase L1-like esterase